MLAVKKTNAVLYAQREGLANVLKLIEVNLTEDYLGFFPNNEKEEDL